MLYRLQVNIARAGNVPVWQFVRPTGGKPYAFATHDEARSMARICYPVEHSHACRIVYEIEPLDAGAMLPGIGLVQARDAGKLGYDKPGGTQWENDYQRDTRLFPVAVIDEESASKPGERLTVLKRFATIREAETWIGEQPDKAKVQRGGYGIDAPETMINPPRG